MRKVTFVMLLIVSQLAAAQESNKVITYKYGYNGMELIVNSTKETIIVSTFNSKIDLKEDIAQKIYHYYRENKDNNCLNQEDTLTINGNRAKVTGKCLVTKRGKLTAVEFYFEKIEWNSGITELYKKNFS